MPRQQRKGHGGRSNRFIDEAVNDGKSGYYSKYTLSNRGPLPDAGGVMHCSLFLVCDSDVLQDDWTIIY